MSTQHKQAYDEWMAKTDWLEGWLKEHGLATAYLGQHRADILRKLIERPDPDTFFERLLQEFRELHERQKRLEAFMTTLRFDVLDHENKRLLMEQYATQQRLLDILNARVYLLREQREKDDGKAQDVPRG